MDGIKAPTVESAKPEESFKLITAAAERLAQKLNEEIARGHDTAAFSIALLLAAAKDGLDIFLAGILIGLVPFWGQIPGWFLTAFLAFFLWGKGWFLNTRIKVAWWVLGIFFDNLPVVNTLPMSILTVLYAWHIVRKRAAAAEKKLDKIKKLTEKEITALNENIALVDE